MGKGKPDNSFELSGDFCYLNLPLIVSDASPAFDFDSNGEITDFGRKLEALYDTVYSQS